jgi:hypothetical protein
VQTDPALELDVEPLFAGKDPIVRAIYARILEVLSSIGEFRVEPKKTSIHLARSSGFAGVHPRKSTLVLNLRLDRAIESPNLVKSEQVSRNRYHNELKLASPEDIDSQAVAWLREAYELA